MHPSDDWLRKAHGRSGRKSRVETMHRYHQLREPPTLLSRSPPSNCSSLSWTSAKRTTSHPAQRIMWCPLTSCPAIGQLGTNPQTLSSTWRPIEIALYVSNYYRLGLNRYNIYEHVMARCSGGWEQAVAMRVHCKSPASRTITDG